MIQNEPSASSCGRTWKTPLARTRRPASSGCTCFPIPWVQPEEISRAVLFLAAEEAGGISGTVMSIDAGASARVTA